MKKFLYGALALASVATLASCSNDEMPVDGAGEGVTFTLDLPDGIGTRASKAFGDGYDAVNLTYAVYKHADAGVGTLVDSKTIPNFFDGTKLNNQLTLNLLTGETYDIVFWAEDGTNAYEFNTDNASITVNYEEMTSNSETFDAFYASDNALKVTGNMSRKVTLNRPFAQVNFGTTDLNYTAVTKEFGDDWANLQTTFTVSGLPTTLNLLNGSVDGATGTFTASVGVPTPTQAFPKIENYTGDPISYLSMSYVLAGKDKDLNDLTFTVQNSESKKVFNTISVAAAPLRANYRTNIFGQLLTSATSFNVVINPIFEKPAYNVLYWDGKTVTLPGIDTKNKQVLLRLPSDFAGLAQMLDNDDYNIPADYTIEVMSDMDFQNQELPQIAKKARLTNLKSKNAIPYKVNGNGHTLSNITLSNSSSLFGGFGGPNAGLSDLTFENFEIEGYGSQVGIVGFISEGAKIDNVKVNSGTISGSTEVGAIVGQAVAPGTINNCSNGATVKGTTINVGGIVGKATGTSKDGVLTISNCNNTGAVSVNCPLSGFITNGYCGGIAGVSSANVTNCNNSGAVTSSGESTGGIIGEQRMGGTVSGCTNTATVTKTTVNYGAGGIIGWIRYAYFSGDSQADFETAEVITVENCTNKGNVISKGQGVGGIVGIDYDWGKINNCVNNAERLEGSLFVAGIIGGQQWGIPKAPAGVDAFGEKTISLTGNNTTTTLDNMVGDCKALLVYINNPGAVTFEGNNPASN